MSGLLNHLGTSTLLKELRCALVALERLGNSKEPELTTLTEHIGDLVEIVGCFDDLSTKERRNPSMHPSFHSVNGLLHLQSVLDSTAAIVDECNLFIGPLQSSLRAIAHERDTAGYVTPQSGLEQQAWYEETHHALSVLAEMLRVLFKAISLLNYQHDADYDARSLEARSATSTQLHFQIGLVEQKLHLSNGYDSIAVRNAIRAARGVTVHCPPIPNQHFVIGRPVRTFFTGREVQLAKLEAAFCNPTLPSQQRFVIFGLSGSGKTELAFKFGDSYRHRFWGVFLVDGSAQKNAISSYAEIATLGGVEPNEKAAKNWLMTRALPWLLIIDNVDSDEVDIDELLPQGAKGCILITTRNPSHMTWGNAGERYLELLPMEAEEAETLIIKAAEEPRPWPENVVESASSICRALGFLPLALIQAAKAIMNGVCEWSGYLTYYDRHIQRVRRSLRNRSRSRSGRSSRLEDDRGSVNVFSSYEILYESLESSLKEEYRDAVELLHVFSYFHFQNIRLDTLINAAINPLKEAEQQKQDDRHNKELEKKLARPPRKPWLMFFRELRAFLNGKMTTPAPLPEVLKNWEGLNLKALEDEVQDRLRKALAVLIERSLVVRQDRASACYSMHRLVHKWVRERPNISTWHQALWCQVSMTTLTLSIRRPPHGDADVERQARRELLPHIRHVKECHTVIRRRIDENATGWRPFWPQKETYWRLQAEQDIHFSRVYAESGHFGDARELQERALSFVSERLGPDHRLSIWLSLFLTKSIWEMSEMDEATKRLRQVRQLCLNTWGEDHPMTLDVTDLLGSALYMKGRWAEAMSLHAGSIPKFERLYGPGHEKTLKAVRNLARLHFRYMDYDEATRLHRRAWEGTKVALGETHLETLFCLEDLAMSYLRYEEDIADASPENDHPDPDPETRRTARLAQSYRDMTFVHDQRKATLGKEHPYTLLAVLFLARLRSALGHHHDAERMIRDGLAVAERNVGHEHLAVLMAKTIYAEVLMRLRRHAEAEALLAVLCDKHLYRHVADADGDHPDRLTALWFLVRCLEDQGGGRDTEALERCEELLAGLADIGSNRLGLNHKMVPRVRAKVAKLRRAVGEAKSSEVKDDCQADEGIIVEI